MKVAWFALAVAVLAAGCKKSEAPKSGAGDSTSSSESIADDGAAATLRVKWPVGNRYAQRMEVSGDTETRMPQSPKPMLQKMSMSQDYSITVLTARPNGGRELELEFESAEIEVTMNGKSVLNMDTKAEADPAESSATGLGAFRQIIGMKIKFLMDASNQVEKVEGIQEFGAKATAGATPQGRAAMQSMFNEDYFKQMVDFQRGLPPKPVKAGESWPVKTDIGAPMLGTLTMDMNYTFKGWEEREKRKCAAIDFAGTMTHKGDAGGGVGGMSMRLESGKLSGRSWFDPELGHPVETMIDQDMLMQISVPAMPPRTNTTNASQASASQSITNNTKNKVVIKLVEVISANK